MKRGTSDHPKIDELSEALDIPRYAAVGILNTLWDWAQRYVPQGDIGKYSDTVIAKKIDWRGDPDILIRVLTEKKWIDRSAEHRLMIHDWPDHCEDSIHTQLARHALLFADGSRPKLTKLPEKERSAIETQYALKCADQRTNAQDGAQKGSTKPLPSQAITKPEPLPNERAELLVLDSAQRLAAAIETKNQQAAAPAELALAATGTDVARVVISTPPRPQLVSRPQRLTDAEWNARDIAAVCHELVNDLATTHPVPGSLDKAFMACSLEAAKQTEVEAWAVQIRKTHAQHCIAWENKQARNPNAYIPNLAVWFSDGDYRHTGVTTPRNGRAASFPRGQPEVKCQHCADTEKIYKPEVLADIQHPKWAGLPESELYMPCTHCQRKENRQ